MQQRKNLGFWSNFLARTHSSFHSLKRKDEIQEILLLLLFMINETLMKNV